MNYFECFSVILMHRCNLTKSDESTFFVLNVDCDESYLLARIDPPGVYSEKRFPHIYLLEENLLHAISKL